MNEDVRAYANSASEIRRILTVEANDVLTRRLDEFSPEATRGNVRLLRTLGARIIHLTNDIDRGPYGVGEGLALKKQERALNDYPYPHRFKLMGDGPYRVGAMALEEGALLRIHLDLTETEDLAVNRFPMFEGAEKPDLYYFVSRRHLVGEVAVKEALKHLRESIAEGESFVTRPRIVEPTAEGWSHKFTKRPPSAPARRSAA